MLDQGEGDDKIIAVASKDMSVSHYNDVFELPEHIRNQIHRWNSINSRFFEDYKKLENKHVEVFAFENREKAFKVVNEAIQLYKDTF